MNTKHRTDHATLRPTLSKAARLAILGLVATTAAACAQPSATTTIVNPDTGLQTTMSTARFDDGSPARIVIERSGTFDNGCERVHLATYEYTERGQLREYTAEEHSCGLVSARVVQRYDADGDISSILAQRDHDGDGLFDDNQWTREPFLQQPEIDEADAAILVAANEDNEDD